MQIRQLAPFSPPSRPAPYDVIDHFEEYNITWSRNGVPMPELTRMFEFNRTAGDASGVWEASVRLYSSQIRLDDPSLQSNARVIV
jgi:hypothetical protein